MPRPKRNRRVLSPPLIQGFKPFGHPLKELETVFLFYEEYEAIKLMDHLNLNHEEAALRMNVSRPTMTRIYEKARKKIADGLVNGKALYIEGGNVVFDDDWYKCGACHRSFTDHNNNCPFCESADIKRYAGEHGPPSRQRTAPKHRTAPNQRAVSKHSLASNPDSASRSGNRAAQDSASQAEQNRKEYCMCPDCGFQQPHEKGKPCKAVGCPHCGSHMKRKH